MSTEAPFTQCRIGPGKLTVIEAAAGTGKTHNITRIVARLIMEREDAAIDNMVIVTFTRAAAAELKNRISALLALLEQRLSREKTGEGDVQPVDDDGRLADEALKKFPRDVVKQRLRRALLNFDQAIIGTIHSFAMRVLRENGIDSGLQLDFVLQENTDSLIKKFCEDYFRSLLFKYRGTAKQGVLEKCGFSGAGPISTYVLARMSAPDIKTCLPGAEPFADAEEALEAAVKPPRGQTSRYRAGAFRAVCEEAFRKVNEKFNRYAEENHFISEDGLILRLREALRNSVQLRNALRARYRIGLIDEFQDTNASQFDIFQMLFLENPESTFIVVGDPRQAIYRFRNCDLDTYHRARKLMEDRGADVFPMNLNRRSGKKYIDALNSIFSPPGSFALEGMDMPEQSALPGSQVLLDPEGNEAAFPIQVFNSRLDLDAVLKRCAADIAGLLDAGYRIPPKKNDKGEIVEPDRPLKSGDIAVLMGTSWKNGRILRDELLKLGVPAVALKGESIFSTPEAEEMVRFLEGVLNPENHSAVLRALITPLGNLDISRLNQAEETAAGIARLQELGAIWQRHSFGVMYSALGRVFQLPDTPEQRRKTGKYTAIADVLAEAEFTRKLTPGALFCELCGYIEEAKKDPDAEKFPAPPETDRDAVVINSIFGSKGLSYPVVFLPDLFSCRSTLKPPCRCHDKNGDQLLVLKLPSRVGFDPGEELQELFRKEKDEIVQESLRKAYVAFTRAKYFCRFYCGIAAEREDPDEIPRHAATDWLFRRPEVFSFSGLEEQMDHLFPAEPHFPASLGAPEIPPAPPENADVSKSGELRRPDLLPDLGFSRGFLNFSNLAGVEHGGNKSFVTEKEDEGILDADKRDEPDAGVDEGNAPDAGSADEMEEILKLRGGTNFGNAVHKLLENVDFSLDRPQLEEKAAAVLDEFGFDGRKMKKTVGGMLWRVLNSPLSDGRGGNFRLCEVDPARRRSEFEFLCRFTSPFGSADLFKTVNTYFAGVPGGVKAAFPARKEYFSQGFFNGSIDLFFEHDSRCYIVDWKTNRLESYSGDALAAVMGECGYCLQYLIYTAALFKYLKQRMAVPPEEEASFYAERFGGVFYLFVRGMRPDRPRSGVFADKPPFDVCKKMEEFIG